VARVKDFNPQEAAISTCAVATLGVTDPHVITCLSQACMDRVRDEESTKNFFWYHIKIL
jgi:hypothetical protein